MTDETDARRAEALAADRWAREQLALVRRKRGRRGQHPTLRPRPELELDPGAVAWQRLADVIDELVSVFDRPAKGADLAWRHWRGRFRVRGVDDATLCEAAARVAARLEPTTAAPADRPARIEWANLWSDIEKPLPRGNVRAWILGVLRREAVKLAREVRASVAEPMAVDTRALRRGEPAGERLERANVEPVAVGDPESGAAALELLQILTHDAGERERLVWSAIADGATPADACRAAGLAPSAFRTLRARARRALS